MSVVIDNGGSCILGRPNSICIGHVPSTYSCNANISPNEMMGICQKQNSEIVLQRAPEFCGENGYPKEGWNAPETSSTGFRIMATTIFWVMLCQIF